MRLEGLSEQEARSRFWVIDKDGLLHSEERASRRSRPSTRSWRATSRGGRGARVETSGSPMWWQASTPRSSSGSRPSGSIHETIVREMARKSPRPIIFPLSNPTSSSEAKPEDLLRWTEGRALVATGTPFAPVSYGGAPSGFPSAQRVHLSRNGLAIVASGAKRVTDGMMLTAALELGRSSPALADPSASLLPRLNDLRRVATKHRNGGRAPGAKGRRRSEDQRGRAAQQGGSRAWTPAYPSFKPDGLVR